MTTSLKEEILALRKNGKNYNEICEILNCSKGTVSYHCNINNIGGNYVSKIKEKLSEVEIEELNTYYINHSIDECVIKFNIGRSTVIKHTKNKYVKLSSEEIRHRNYNKVKTHRQRLKEKSITYKGGCCEKCGYDRCNSALEFHHLDPNKKDFGIGSYSVLSWEKIKLELDKCIMVCANCHREIHHNLFGT
jgi:DNA-binding CsgD family transcriptional regulator